MKWRNCEMTSESRTLSVRAALIAIYLTLALPSHSRAVGRPSQSNDYGGAQAGSDGQLETGRQAYQAGHFDVALPKLLPYARKGNPEAEYMVGEMYVFGYSVLVPKK
jgi:hypothetical protein